MLENEKDPAALLIQMIESNNPEIDVDELMARIREEVARRRVENSHSMTQLVPPQVPTTEMDWSRMDAPLLVAEQHAQMEGFVPGWTRFGRVRRRLAQLTARFILYLSSFITNQQKRFNRAVLQSLQAMRDGLRNLENGLVERDGRLGGLEAELAQRDNQIEGRLRRLEAELAQRDNQIEGLEQAVNAGRDSTVSLGQKHQDQLEKLWHEVAQRTGRIQELERTFLQLKTDLILQERRLTLLLEEARKRLPEPFNQEQLQILADEDKHRLNALYVGFEDQFRGTREEIKERLQVYLPFINGVAIGAEKMPILDIGCGRGEWLELLKEEGLLARGVDINRVWVEWCRQHELDVVEDDVATYLHGLPNACLSAVTGFHIIEHLPFDLLIKLLDETVRVLRPGGIAIFETPNPQNILVGSCNFYLDPTHRNPLPSPMMKFMAEARGLCRVEVLYLHPYPEAFRLEGSDLAERFNEYFYGSQDYAVIGWKA